MVPAEAVTADSLEVHINGWPGKKVVASHTSRLCDYANWGEHPINRARACGSDGNCVALTQYPNVTISDYGSVSGSSAMMKEIYNRGPIACTVDADPLDNYQGGITHASGFGTNHVISVVGWGTDAGKKYWVVRNSWGEAWGEFGYFRSAFGALSLDSCYWAVPKDFTAPELDNGMHCFKDGSNCAGAVEKRENSNQATEELTREEVLERGMKWHANSHSKSSHDQLSSPVEGYPIDFTWCNKDGVNYCSTSANQHLPQYCESSPISAALTALEDRIKIDRKAAGTDIRLSVQHVLNCGSSAGTCQGGDHNSVYQWIKDISDTTGTGVSYITQQPYLACSADSTSTYCAHGDWSCTALNTARICGTFGEECVGASHYPNATIAEYGHISGISAMQQIYNRGPIACSVDGAPLEQYTTGVVSCASNSTNHVVTVVGWGSDADGAYWVVRNTWGEFWGEHGYARIRQGSLGIESSCSWAVVGDFTTIEKENYFPCSEDGDNCLGASHYGAPPCQPDEEEVQVLGKGTVCAALCSADSDCSSDKPWQTDASVHCNLGDLPGHCGLKCGMNSGCPSGAKCMKSGLLSLTGVCAFPTSDGRVAV